MSIRTIATLVAALVLGLIAVIILNTYLGSRKPAAQVAAGGGTQVVIAAQLIPRGAVLQPALLKVVDYPQGSVPTGAFGTIDQLAGAKAAQRVALRDITPDEPILNAELSGSGGRPILSSVLAAGMQAVAIRVNDVAGVGGFILPGDRVDVLLTRTFTIGNAPQNSVTQIVAENVRVMGVDQSDDDQANKPEVVRAVTVEVTPPQAQTITLGQSVGTVTLSLRHVADSEALAKLATTANELGFVSAPARPPAPAKPAPDAGAKAGDVPLYGPGIVRVTRTTDTTGYRLGAR